MTRQPDRDLGDDDWDVEEWSDDIDDDPGDDSSYESDTVECPACGRDLYDDAERCPHCGEYLTEADRLGRGKPLWMVLTAVVVLAALLAVWVL